MISEREFNIIRGKMLGGVASPHEVLQVMSVMDYMETLLDRMDNILGQMPASFYVEKEGERHYIEGWRAELGWEE